MIIVILSKIDFAGSGYKLYEALKRHTNHEVHHFSGHPNNKLKHPIGTIVTHENRQEIQAIINTADIIHFKGDWPPVNGYLGFTIPDKPIVLTTAGSYFRKRENGGLGTFNNSQYGLATLKTSFETDLLYPEYSDIWTPHPIDADDKEILWQPNPVPVFMHIPSNPKRKGTKFVKEVFAILKDSIECETEIITGVNFATASEAKKRATIYFDQFFVGFYGNSALEAMQWGIPTVAWISPQAIRQAKDQLDGCPIINENMSDPHATANRIINFVQDENLSKLTKKWCDDKHGFKSIAKQWDKLYNGLI